MSVIEDRYILVICFERNATYSHTVRIEKSKALDVIESWSRTHNGLCEVIDMHKIAEDIRNGKAKINHG